MSQVEDRPATPMMPLIVGGVLVIAVAGLGVVIPLARGVAVSAWSTSLLTAHGASLVLLGSPTVTGPWPRGALISVAVASGMAWFIGGVAG